RSTRPGTSIGWEVRQSPRTFLRVCRDKVLWDLSPNNRLKLTALASSVSSLYGGAAIDRAAAWPERYEGKRLLPEVPSFVRHGAP
ncbi:MAG: hypothetical protein ACXW34_10560, partial [Nitrospira sp.]